MWFPETIALRCKVCGRNPLWIEAFVVGDDEEIPVLVCHSHFGCGTVFELKEYGLREGLIG